MRRSKVCHLLGNNIPFQNFCCEISILSGSTSVVVHFSSCWRWWDTLHELAYCTIPPFIISPLTREVTWHCHTYKFSSKHTRTVSYSQGQHRQGHCHTYKDNSKHTRTVSYSQGQHHQWHCHTYKDSSKLKRTLQNLQRQFNTYKDSAILTRTLSYLQDSLVLTRTVYYL